MDDSRVGYAVLDFLDDGIGRDGKGMICSITNKAGNSVVRETCGFSPFFSFSFSCKRYHNYFPWAGTCVGRSDAKRMVSYFIWICSGIQIQIIIVEFEACHDID
jgi:hypothetical protein